VGSADLFKSCLAGLGAALACLGADPAVLVHVDMALALVAATTARLSADLNGGSKNLDIGACAPGRHCSGCRTDIGAVQVQPDALPEIGNHVFRQTRVSA
jgi:hypothetical protein